MHMKQSIEDRLLAFQATLANEHAELIEDALDELEARNLAEMRWIARMADIREASGAAYKITLDDLPCFIRVLRGKAEAQ